MKFKIFAILILTLFSCMCTPKPDSVRIVGLNLISDSNYTKGSGSLYLINLKTVKQVFQPKEQFCLTYNKLKAADILKNQIISSSIHLTCDKEINDVNPGQNIDIIKMNSAHELVGVMPDDHLEKNVVYEFTLNCKTTDSLNLRVLFNLRVN